MALFKKIALRDAPSNRRRGGDLRVVLGPASAGATAGFLGVLTLAPGEYISEHCHPHSEEFLYAVEGTVQVRLDGEELTLDADEGVLVPANVRHRVANLGTTPAKIVFHMAPLADALDLRVGSAA
jgi:putative monooxygenase